MVGMFRSQPNAGTVVEPQAALLRLLLRNLEPLPSPDSLDPLDVHRPASPLQQRRDTAVAIAAILGGQRDDIGGQGRLIIRRRGNLALRGAVLPENPARKALRDSILGDHPVHAGTATSGA